MRGLRIIAYSVSIYILAMSAAVSFAATKEADNPVGKTYYTAVNIWFEKPEQIFSSNFHKGQFIPINTKVTITGYKNSGFTFTDNNDIAYKIVYVPKHSVLPIKEIFNQYFSKQEVSMSRFTEEERKNIETGTIAVGMSKEAVLAAYGYPLAHQTPSIKNNQWKYWKNRIVSFLVYFSKEGKVAKIGDNMRF